MKDLKPFIRELKVLGVENRENAVKVIRAATGFTTNAIVNAAEQANLCERCRSSLVASLERAAVTVKMAYEEVNNELPKEGGAGEGRAPGGEPPA